MSSEAQGTTPDNRRPAKTILWRIVLAVAWCVAAFCFVTGVVVIAGGIRQTLISAAAPSFVRRTAEETAIRPGDDRWRIGVIGDMRGDDLTFQPMLRQLSEKRVDATFILGDMVPYSSERVFRHYAGMIVRLRGEHAGLGEVFFLPGNHEIDDETGLAPYEKWFGRTCLAVRIGKALFLLLDNSSETIAPAQREWIAGWMKRASHEKLDVFLCMHYAPAGCGTKRSMAEDDTEFVRKIVRDSGRVRTILASHLHSYAEASFEGVPVYISGGGGAPIDKVVRGEYHYMVLEENPDGGASATYVGRPDPVEIRHGTGRVMFFLGTQPPYVLWPSAIGCLLPMAAMVLLRRRANTRTQGAAGGERPC